MSESALIKYDAACRALAEAKSVDEVKKIRNASEMLRAYGKQAKNKSLELDGAEIRIRAERRLGEMIAAQKATVGLNSGAKGIGNPKSAVPRRNHTQPTLADAGIDKKLSSSAQKLAAVSEKQFDQMIGDWRDRATSNSKRKRKKRISVKLDREDEDSEKLNILNMPEDQLKPLAIQAALNAWNEAQDFQLAALSYAKSWRPPKIEGIECSIDQFINRAEEMANIAKEWRTSYETEKTLPEKELAVQNR